MYTRFAFLRKKPSLTFEEFVERYEHGHIPLVCSLLPEPPLYKRRYILRDQAATMGDVDFDVVTEVGFASEGDYFAWKNLWLEGDKLAIIQADEEAFLDRAATRSFALRDIVTSEAS